jgi:hypothetical protein
MLSITDKFLAGVSASLVAAFLVLGWAYRSNVSEFAAYRAAVEAQGEQAQKEQDALRAANDEAIRQIRSDYEKQIDAVRDNAVAAYRVRKSNTGSRGVRKTQRDKVDDGTEPEPIFAATLRNCAEDALKLSAWQAWCRKIKCPVEE